MDSAVRSCGVCRLCLEGTVVDRCHGAVDRRVVKRGPELSSQSDGFARDAPPRHLFVSVLRPALVVAPASVGLAADHADHLAALGWFQARTLIRC